MGAYNQGAGGGRAGGPTDDQFVLDQPYEVDGKFTPDTAQKINEMFSILFKALRRTEDVVNKSIAGTNSVLVASIQLNTTQLDTLSTVPVTIIPSPGPRKIIIPLSWAIKVTKTTAWTNNPSFRLQWAGSTATLCTSLSSGLSSGAPAAGSNYHTSDATTQTIGFNNPDPTFMDTAVEVQFTTDGIPAAGDITTAFITVAYYIHSV